MQQRIEPSSQPPPKNKGTIYVPILVNTVVLLAIKRYFIDTSTNNEINEISPELISAIKIFGAMCTLTFFNLVGLVITAVTGRTKTAIGLGLSMLGIIFISYGYLDEFAPQLIRGFGSINQDKGRNLLLCS